MWGVVFLVGGVVLVVSGLDGVVFVEGVELLVVFFMGKRFELKLVKFIFFFSGWFFFIFFNYLIWMFGVF